MSRNSAVDSKVQDPTVKGTLQSQLTRIKKEEEEEMWISGEELYTEGSSDEEDCKIQSRSRRKLNNGQTPRASSANPSTERRDRSPTRTEVRAKSESPIDTSRERTNTGESDSQNTLRSHKTSSLSTKSMTSLSMESQRTDLSSTIESTSDSIRIDGCSMMNSRKENKTTVDDPWKGIKGSFVVSNSYSDITDAVEKD